MLANHESIHQQSIEATRMIPGVHGHPNVITSVEHKVDGNVRVTLHAATAYSRQIVHVYLYVKSNFLGHHMDHLFPLLLYFALPYCLL